MLLDDVWGSCSDTASLQTGGSAGLQQHLAQEAEAALPEFKRKRPKYYYYFEWMRKVGAARPHLLLRERPTPQSSTATLH